MSPYNQKPLGGYLFRGLPGVKVSLYTIRHTQLCLVEPNSPAEGFKIFDERYVYTCLKPPSDQKRERKLSIALSEASTVEPRDYTRPDSMLEMNSRLRIGTEAMENHGPSRTLASELGTSRRLSPTYFLSSQAGIEAVQAPSRSAKDVRLLFHKYMKGTEVTYQFEKIMESAGQALIRGSSHKSFLSSPMAQTLFQIFLGRKRVQFPRGIPD